MSDPDKAAPGPEDVVESEDGRAMASLLKRALGEAALPSPDKSVLAGVQRKIRQRSRGKFYRDGWSTTSAPASYILVAAIMLVIAGIVYFALGPVGIAAH